MNHILKKGNISQLVSDSGSTGWSGEVHLVTYNNEKYVVRKCSDLAKAKSYEKISKRFEKYGFLPRFLGRIGKDVIYEYIDGRDLRKKESKDIIKQVGKICAQINKVKTKGKVDERFNSQLVKIISLRKFLSKEEVFKIKAIYSYLRKRTKPEMRLDANDVLPTNFRLRKDKVYLVDVEGIRPRIRLFAVGKAFLKWFKTPLEQKSFKEGYKSVSSMKFFSKECEDFIYLNFIIQDIYYSFLFRKKQKPNYKIRLEQLRRLLNKYSEKIK